MPELPEVETTRRGVAPHVSGRTITGVTVREHRLRQPIPAELPRILLGQRLLGVRRRAKYLLFDFRTGTLIVHLGMSGSLRIVSTNTPSQLHDHVDLEFDRGQSLRLRDPRRFGLMLWTTEEPAHHPLLANLGPEPWDPAFNSSYLCDLAKPRTGAVKNFLMDSHVVVGVGNIYASESLHRAGIHPSRPARRISSARYGTLIEAVREVLDAAITFGGTTLRDFIHEDGKPGYFRNELRVYDRAGKPCLQCGDTDIRSRVIGQRMSYFCPHCQR
ncbi:MAG: bifunctional DNA-formamidopyrimidine glycosylase/DNA-(apurinic or apyrimidinic site) lyase [Gammaproteobacteria bacterium]|nr:bifunctional DNA-formamidopyrimidine glycosylase/DNA-(apurinic or apyrimidinic site) lyase [Gammaproteobacteria bacterium]